jgi:hypothetical protein
MSAAKPKKPGLPEGPIQPFDLACACYLYESMTPYAKSLDRFHAKKFGAALDLGREDRRLALLQFLNDWGCRHLAKEWHWLASEELERWYSDARDLFRLPDSSAASLNVSRLSDLADAFDSLFPRIAAKPTKEGKEVLVSFGPTATSKSLFALMPHTLPAWDDPMRAAFGHGGDGESYVEFTKDIHNKIRETEQYCKSQGFDLEGLPAKLGRPPYTTLCQLVVEYYWITVTQKVSLPSKDTMRVWLSWCDKG